MAVLSVSSQVAQGYVGNSATAYALRRLAHDVWDIPTVVLSHHPGHGRPAGMKLPSETVAEMIASVIARARPSVFFSGYLADPANAGVIAERIRGLRQEGGLPYILDPVMGDDHTGLYVDEKIASAIRQKLVPLATILLPNRFELDYLAGQETGTLEQCVAAGRTLIETGPDAVICTSAPAEPGRIRTLAVTANDAWVVEMSEVPSAPHGTGDLFAGVFMAKWLDGAPLQEAMGYAAGAVHAVAAWSRAIGKDDLALAEAQSGLNEPPVLPDIETV